MNYKLQLVLLIGSILLLIYLINMVRTEKYDLKYSLLWIIIDIGVIISCFFPKTIDVLAKIVGIETSVNLIFFIGILLQICIIFALTKEQSKNSKKIKDMAQQLALLQFEIDRRLKNNDN